MYMAPIWPQFSALKKKMENGSSRDFKLLILHIARKHYVNILQNELNSYIYMSLSLSGVKTDILLNYHIPIKYLILWACELPPASIKLNLVLKLINYMH